MLCSIVTQNIRRVTQTLSGVTQVLKNTVLNIFASHASYSSQVIISETIQIITNQKGNYRNMKEVSIIILERLDIQPLRFQRKERYAQKKILRKENASIANVWSYPTVRYGRSQFFAGGAHTHLIPRRWSCLLYLITFSI